MVKIARIANSTEKGVLPYWPYSFHVSAECSLHTFICTVKRAENKDLAYTIQVSNAEASTAVVSIFPQPLKV